MSAHLGDRPIDALRGATETMQRAELFGDLARAVTLGTAVAKDTENNEEPETGWRATVNRLSPMYLRPAKPKGDPDSTVEPAVAVTDEDKRRAIVGLDPLERKIGLLGAALATLIAVTTTLPFVLNPKTAVNQSLAPVKAHICANKAFTYDKATNKCNGKVVYSLEHWVFALVLLLVFALALFVTVRIGRRAPVGFTALMTGLAYETQVGVLGLPFIAAGGWLLIRALRVQRYGSPTATKANPTGEKRPPPTRAERPTRQKKKRAAAPTGPAPNKRYTPKTPQRKRPVSPPPES